MINALSNVELMSPPSITLAMGDCISLPGRSPPSASGTRASAEVRAVMSMGLSRESEPSMMASFTVLPSSVRSRLYSVMSSMPLRVAMPKSEMKPMMAGMLTSPVVMTMAKMPPMSASGRLSSITPASIVLRNCMNSSRKMMAMAIVQVR